MKTLTALCISAALLVGAGVAQAKDVSPAKTVELSNSGAILSFDKLDTAALAQHPGARILDTELNESYGRYIYEIELLTVQGQVRELKFDASSGGLLEDEEDD